MVGDFSERVEVHCRCAGSRQTRMSQTRKRRVTCRSNVTKQQRLHNQMHHVERFQFRGAADGQAPYAKDGLASKRLHHRYTVGKAGEEDCGVRRFAPWSSENMARRVIGGVFSLRRIALSVTHPPSTSPIMSPSPPSRTSSSTQSPEGSSTHFQADNESNEEKLITYSATLYEYTRE